MHIHHCLTGLGNVWWQLLAPTFLHSCPGRISRVKAMIQKSLGWEHSFIAQIQVDILNSSWECYQWSFSSLLHSYCSPICFQPPCFPFRTFSLSLTNKKCDAVLLRAEFGDGTGQSPSVLHPRAMLCQFDCIRYSETACYYERVNIICLTQHH